MANGERSMWTVHGSLKVENMKREDEDTGTTSSSDLYLAEKEARARRVQLADARETFAAAMETYAAGDPVVGLGLLREALRTLNAAARPADLPGLEAIELLKPEQLAAHSLCNTIESVLELFQPELFLQLAKDEFSRDFKFKKGGSFKGKGTQNPTSIRDDSEMKWRFYVDKNVACKKLCLISVFHFKDKNKKIVKPAREGFSKSYRRAHTLPRHENTLPHAGEDVNGYSVDTPFYDPFLEQKIECPCYPGNYRINDKGKKDDKAKKHIGGGDIANAQRNGFVEYFETAVVCLDKKPYVILNSMKWRTDGKKAAFLDKKGGLIKSGKVQDLGDASDAFKRALLDWIKRAKKEHSIKDINCSKLFE